MGGNNSRNAGTFVLNHEQECGEDGSNLLFHDTCGTNVQLSSDKKTAQRTKSFCFGIAFSDRPIDINEWVHLKLERVEETWSGVMRLGVTFNDPSMINATTLPRYACPDLTSLPGYWAKALPEDFSVQSNIISFFVDENGNFRMWLNGETCGTFIEGIPTNEPLWVLTDIYGNTAALKFIDCPFRIEVGDDLNNVAENESVEEDSLQIVERRDTVDSELHESAVEELRSSFFLSPLTQIRPSAFSLTAGNGVQIRDRNAVCQLEATLYRNSLVVSPPTSKIVLMDEPLPVGGNLYLKVTTTAACDMLLGVTSCDPSTVDPSTLPLNSIDLVDREEYWVVDRLRNQVEDGDYLVFSLHANGWFRYRINSGDNVDLFCCDVNQSLRLFFDLGQDIQEILLVGVSEEEPDESLLAEIDAQRSRRVFLVDDEDDVDSLPPPFSRLVLERGESNSQTVFPLSTDSDDEQFYDPLQRPPLEFTPVSSDAEDHDQQFSFEGVPPNTEPRRSILGHMFRRILPSRRSARSESTPIVNTDMGNSSGEGPSHSRSTVNVPFSGSSEAPSNGENKASARGEKESGDRTQVASECSICFCDKADAAIYDCGHVCMCMACARALTQRERFPRCPICRNQIKDIMKLYHV